MADNYAGRIRVIEFEDDSLEIKKKRELLEKAKFLIYDFGALENVPLIDVLNFKNTTDKGLKFTIATFEVLDDKLKLTAGMEKFPVVMNGETVPALSSVELNFNDVVEFMECKYLINNNPGLDETEARALLGRIVIERSTLGLKRGLGPKEEQFKKVSRDRDDCFQLVEVSKMKLRDAASKKQLMAAILQKRENLKKQFMQAKLQVEEIESQNLEKVIADNSIVLADLDALVAKTAKELAQMKEGLERREKMDVERKKQMMEASLEKEEEELKRKLEELQKKRKAG